MKAVYRVATGEVLSTQEGNAPDHVLLRNAVENYQGAIRDYGVFSGPDALHDELQVALSRKVVEGELVLEKAADHPSRVGQDR